jgi:hypothetical protein
VVRNEPDLVDNEGVQCQPNVHSLIFRVWQASNILYSRLKGKKEAILLSMA